MIKFSPILKMMTKSDPNVTRKMLPVDRITLQKLGKIEYAYMVEKSLNIKRD